ncbi:MAG: hypothetical protein M5U29_12855 [Anaerolineae bacterium]|nr:hypothetical protein [Anaerolineae bacterium]
MPPTANVTLTGLIAHNAPTITPGTAWPASRRTSSASSTALSASAAALAIRANQG